MRTGGTVLERHPDITWYPTTCNNLRLDPALTLFTEVQDEGNLSGPESGFNHDRIASQKRMLRARHLHGVHRLRAGHLRPAMHHVDNGILTPGSMWDFYLIGGYGLTATAPIATNAMKPSLLTLHHYLTMIEEATVRHSWCTSIWGQGGCSTI